MKEISRHMLKNKDKEKKRLLATSAWTTKKINSWCYLNAAMFEPKTVELSCWKWKRHTVPWWKMITWMINFHKASKIINWILKWQHNNATVNCAPFMNNIVNWRRLQRRNLSFATTHLIIVLGTTKIWLTVEWCAIDSTLTTSLLKTWVMII